MQRPDLIEAIVRSRGGAVARREFMTLLGALAAAWPAMASAQQRERTPRIGALMAYSESDPAGQALVATFTQELGRLGWTIGHNVLLDVRWAGSDAQNFYSIADALTDEHPDVILAVSNLAVTAVRQRTTSIPIVFTQVSDPIGRGFVTSLARPEGNVTGFSSFETTMGGKWLDMLKQVAPGVRAAALIFDPATSPHIAKGYYLRVAEDAGRQLAVETVIMPVQSIAETEQSIGRFAGTSNGGLVVLPDTFTIDHAELLVALAARFNLPAVYPYPLFARRGGLLSYGIDTKDQYIGAATYIDRILKGATPAELPVQFPNRFYLTINLNTAKALGLTIPPTLLVTAAEVIQ